MAPLTRKTLTRKQMHILAIESSAKVGSVAIMEDDSIICSITSGVERTHSEKLMPLVDRAITESGIRQNDLDAIAVSIGPGSFTGLRIGVGLAKGLAFALNIPVVPVETLLALAYNLPGSDIPVCAVCVSRKEELFTATFQWCEDRFERLCDDAADSPEEIAGRITERTIFIGDGVDVWGEFFQQALGDLFAAAPESEWRPRAETIGKLGFESFDKGEYPALADLTPKYVREPTPIVKKRQEREKNR